VLEIPKFFKFKETLLRADLTVAKRNLNVMLTVAIGLIQTDCPVIQHDQRAVQLWSMGHEKQVDNS